MHKKSVGEGHWEGIRKLRELANWAKELNIKYLTVWALSTENLMREEKEVKILFRLFNKTIKNLVKEKIENTEIKFYGNLNMLPKEIRNKIKEVERKYKGELKLSILIAYGGRKEIIDAVNKIIKDAKKGRISKVSEEKFRSYLYAPDIPDPDLIIRTSEKRLSGIFPWQSTYSEVYFCNKLWPDFEREDLIKAVREYKKRKRRFGK